MAAPEYYEGVVLTTIHTLNEREEKTGIRDIMRHCGLYETTILNALSRLEAKGRLTITPGKFSNLPNTYQTKPPSNFDKAAYNLHLASRNGV